VIRTLARTVISHRDFVETALAQHQTITAGQATQCLCKFTQIFTQIFSSNKPQHAAVKPFREIQRKSKNISIYTTTFSQTITLDAKPMPFTLAKSLGSLVHGSYKVFYSPEQKSLKIRAHRKYRKND
jgi:hypothetical protein